MKNISFDNPYLLLIAVPLLLLLILPFVMAIRKENRSKSVVISFILHILIIVCVALAVAGTVVTTVMTETQVWIVADVSYSANRNLEKVDEYIGILADKLPQNSKIGVVCFGKDSATYTKMGEKVTSVRDAVNNGLVDDSATNISGALDYAATLFDDDVIKRIVLITDGRETDTDATREFVRSVENLANQHIYIDAVYLDDNLAEEAKEVQISGVDVAGSTYLGHETIADVLVQSSYETKAIVTLSKNGTTVSETSVSLTKGYNVVNIVTDTSTSGTFDYNVSIRTDEDESDRNNNYYFTQSVAGHLQVLLVSTNEADLAQAQSFYGDHATVTAYINDPNVPCSIEEISQYDEIVISNVDVRELNNVTAFVDAVDKAVSLFGKSLVTMGDLKMQNKEDESLKQLEDMLPVKYGNSDRDKKLYAIVLDTSRSMQNASRLIMAKQTAIYLLNLLDDDDMVTVISFSGDVSVVWQPTRAVNRDDIAEKIESIQPTQGTYIGLAMQTAFGLMTEYAPNYDDLQVMLISDGMSYTKEDDQPPMVAQQMLANNIITSVINTSCQQGVTAMQQIASAGGGHYYQLEDERDLEELIFTQVADDMTETVIEKPSPVTLVRENDDILDGITYLPDVDGYVYAKAKASATTVLSTEYEKSSGTLTEPPLYVYWEYGNGRVCSFMSAYTGEWISNWNTEDGQQFLANLVTVNTPEERVAYPYTLNVTYDGTFSALEVLPAVLDPYATVDMVITFPNGDKIERRLSFDSEKYTYSFATPDLGKYDIVITYTTNGKAYEAAAVFNISYSPEYDSFAIFNPSTLHAAIRNYGTVSEGETPEIVNDEKEVATYTVYFTVPLLIIAIVLYVIDIFIRKIKWNDIKSLFVRKIRREAVK